LIGEPTPPLRVDTTPLAAHSESSHDPPAVVRLTIIIDEAASGDADGLKSIMRPLLRVAFWLGVIILLLPASPTRQIEPARIVRSAENSQLEPNAFHRYGNCTYGGRNALGANCSERAKRMRSQDTLTRDDLAVRWRG
jgi:hypothetical protein